jgi:hypothetical protein
MGDAPATSATFVYGVPAPEGRVTVMRRYVKPLGSALTAIFTLLATAGTAVAGQYLDALEAGKRGDYATEYNLLRPLVDTGNADAQATLGSMYLMGHFVPQDDAEAAKLFRLAADQGNAGGQDWLGRMYAEGRGVPQDYGEALKWYRLAAHQSFPPALFDLGVMYGKGDGGERDFVQAHMWFTLAASNFTRPFEKEWHDKAVRNRDWVASKMTPTQIAEAQKLAREWKPEGTEKAFLLMVTWLMHDQPPSNSQVTFSSLEACEAARLKVVNDAQRVRQDRIVAIWSRSTYGRDAGSGFTICLRGLCGAIDA